MILFFFIFYKSQQLKEVLYDGLDKMPLKDGNNFSFLFVHGALAWKVYVININTCTC